MNINVRAALLENALQLFARKGYENVGVQEIVSSADVTKPTLYHYFGSKRGLLETIFAEKFASLTQGLESLEATPIGELKPALTQLARLYFTFARDNPEFFRLFFAMVFASEESDPYLVASAHATRQHDTVIRILDPLRTPEGPQANTPFLAASFVGRLHNFISWYLHRRVTLDESLLTLAVDGFLYGVLDPAKP